MMAIYADRVDPLMKILHLPTFFATLISGLQHPRGLSKSLEAITFAFYFVTIISLEQNECYEILGEQKSVMSSRYKIAARQALINAEFLNTSSLVTLQAYTMFIVKNVHTPKMIFANSNRWA